MDSNTILIWMAGLSTGLLALRLVLMKGRRPRGWLVVTLLVLTALGGTWLWLPDHAGHIGGGLWGLLILTPLLATKAQTQAVIQRRWTAAARAARVAALTHPADGLTEQPLLVRVLQALDEGREEDVADELAELEASASPLAWTAQVLRFRTAGDWQGLVDWVELRGVAPVVAGHPPVLAGYLRALGELGRTAEMLDVYALHGENPVLRRDPASQALVAAQVAAFAGRPDVVADLFEGAAGSVPGRAAVFWRASAEQVAGDEEAAADLLVPLLDGGRASLTRDVQRRLERPLAPLPAGALSPAQVQLVEGLAAAAAHERRFAGLTTGARRTTPATTLLIAVLGLAYAVEVPGGPTDLENLVELGALVVPAGPGHDEWWRFLAAGLLHFGPVHLAMNVLGLLLLGRWVERTLGSAALVVCHLVCTAASLGLFPVFSDATRADPHVVVGASGGIMGLLGVLLGVLLVGRLSGRSPLVASQLRLLLLLIGLQVTFDSLTPQVSSLAHLLGLVTGIVLGLGAGVWRARAVRA